MLSLSDHGPPAPCPTLFNMAAHVLAHAERHPDKPALEVLHPSGAEVWSYARLAASVRGVGTGLLAMGLHPGDRILMRLGNTPDFPVLFLAAIAAGLVQVPTSAQLTAREITTMAADIAPALIVAAPGIALPDIQCPVLPAADMAAMASLPPVAWDMGPPDRLAYIVFTSGTSGRASAVGHAHRAIWARRMMHSGWEGLTPEDRLLHAGHFNWTYTLGTGLMDPWAMGATALIPGNDVETADIPRLLQDHAVTIFAAAPGVYRQILRQHITPMPALRHGLSAGEKLPDPLRLAWCTATNTDLHEALGMSECSTFISGAPNRPAPIGSTGYAQPGRRVAILGDAGPVPIGTPGILAIHRSDPGLFLGYMNNHSQTKAQFRNDWFLTGDCAVMAADGAITYLGRDDDMMNAGGFRVSPQEVEVVIATYPGITECAVTSVQVTPGVNLIACFYVASEDIDKDHLSSFAAQHLARYKQPRIYTRLDHLPRSANAKINRRALTVAQETHRNPNDPT